MTGKIELPEIPELEFAPEPPPKGPLVWMKDNLFGGWPSGILTVVGLILSWALARGIAGFLFNFESQRWDAVTVNMRLLMAQAYPAGENLNIVDASGVPINQFHRVWISVGIVVVLSALSMAYWRVGGRMAPQQLTRAPQVAGGLLLFVFLGVPVIDYLVGIVGGLDFGGFAWQFSSGVHFTWIAVGALLALIGWLIERALGDRAREPLFPTIGVVGALAAIIVGSLWFIRVPVPESEDFGARKVWEGLATTTSLPWTWLLLIGFGSFFLGRALMRVIPEATGRKILTGLWLLSFPVIVLAILRDPGWAPQYAEGFELSQYLLIGAGFLVVGGALLWFASRPDVGEWGAAIAGVLLVLAVGSWTVATLMLIRLLLIVTLVFVLGAKTFGGATPARRRYLVIWTATLVVVLYLMILAKGGSTVDVPGASAFGGLILTFIIFIAVMLLSFPLGILLALGRTSTMPIFRLISVTYIELVRAVPLITWLLMSVIFLPFAIPLGTRIDGVVTVILFYSGFAAAYLAENVRGGLQAISGGQTEASKSLGLTTLQTIMFITLPQALRTVIPALVGQAIAVFKDTSLVTIIGLFDFLHITRFIIPNQSRFIGSIRTTLIVAAVVYWIFTFAMSRASQRLERKLGVGER